MSNKISGRVWELELDPIDKLVLLALSDHADHNGDNVRPGNELLVAKTGLSEKTITAKIAKFIEDGILDPVVIKIGRGFKRQFSMTTEHVPRRKYFIEKEKKKAERASTFPDRKRANPLLPFKGEKAVTGSTFRNQKVEPDATKVEPDAGKVEPDAKAQELPLMERARAMNPHEEPSWEPDLLPPSASPSGGAGEEPREKQKRKSREDDPLFVIFCELFEVAHLGEPYAWKKADFVQLAELRKRYAQAKPHPWEITEERFRQAANNYFVSENKSQHTLADLCVGFSGFYSSAQDRFGRPKTTNGKPGDSEAARKSMLIDPNSLSVKTRGNAAALQEFVEQGKRDDKRRP